MNFPRIAFTVAAGVGVMTLPLAAQTSTTTPSSGPVHFPADYSAVSGTNALASNAAPVAPSTSLSAAPAGSTAPPAVTSTPAPSAAPATASNVDDAQDIHDIRGVMMIPYQWLWVAYIAAGLTTLALIYALWRWLGSRVRTPAKQPYEIALDRLEAARALMNENQVREYAFTVSEIIRSYIEQRFGERAAHRTTEEFLSDLLYRPNNVLNEHRGLLENFLNHCDLPKFARWQLSVHEMESMHESARAFISDTRPQPQPAKPRAQPELVPAK